MTSYPADLAARVYDKLTDQGVKCPSVETLRGLFEVMYFASLKTEEGKPVQFSVTYSNPQNPDPKPPARIRAYRWKHISLDPRKLFTVRNVSKLARAVDPWTSLTRGPCKIGWASRGLGADRSDGALQHISCEGVRRRA